MSVRTALTCSLAVFGLISAADAQNRDRNAPRAIGGAFDNPTGIAIHPETRHIFVADRTGVTRLARERRQEGQRPQLKRVAEITGFPSDIYGKGPMFDIGPLGLAFLDDEHLIVADGIHLTEKGRQVRADAARCSTTSCSATARSARRACVRSARTC